MQLKFGFQCQGTEFLLKKHCSVDPTFRNDLYNHVHDCHFFSLHRISISMYRVWGNFVSKYYLSNLV
jgi:hypothetical protein